MLLNLAKNGRSTRDILAGKLTDLLLHVPRPIHSILGASILFFQLVYLKIVSRLLRLKSQYLDLKMRYLNYRVDHLPLWLRAWGWCQGLSHDDLLAMSRAALRNRPIPDR